MHIRVVAAVITRGEHFLVCLRPPHKRHGGMWEFPGGKLEPGETDHDAIARELREELNVQAESNENAEFVISDPDSPFVIEFIRTRIFGEPESREHTCVTWGTLTEIEALPLAPSDRRYVEHLRMASHRNDA